MKAELIDPNYVPDILDDISEMLKLGLMEIAFKSGCLEDDISKLARIYAGLLKETGFIDLVEARQTKSIEVLIDAAVLASSWNAKQRTGISAMLIDAIDLEIL